MNLDPVSEFSLACVSALIVEDENLVAMDVESLLREFGAARVWSTGTLSQARRILSENADISIVLLDLKLQDGCGEELLGELALANVPVIVTTGYANFGSTLAPVIYKPYSTKNLLEKILETLRLPAQQSGAGELCNDVSLMTELQCHSRAVAPARPQETHRRRTGPRSGCRTL
jgi:DNA-binding NtrC family response regulator